MTIGGIERKKGRNGEKKSKDARKEWPNLVWWIRVVRDPWDDGWYERRIR